MILQTLTLFIFISLSGHHFANLTAESGTIIVSAFSTSHGWVAGSTW